MDQLKHNTLNADEPVWRESGVAGLEGLRGRLEDPGYMNAAVEALARNLCTEFMEIEYGIEDISKRPFSRSTLTS